MGGGRGQDTHINVSENEGMEKNNDAGADDRADQDRARHTGDDGSGETVNPPGCRSDGPPEKSIVNRTGLLPWYGKLRHRIDLLPGTPGSL